MKILGYRPIAYCTCFRFWVYFKCDDKDIQINKEGNYYVVEETRNRFFMRLFGWEFNYNKR
jgi:hypothetical protein